MAAKAGTRKGRTDIFNLRIDFTQQLSRSISLVQLGVTLMQVFRVILAVQIKDTFPFLRVFCEFFGRVTLQQARQKEATRSISQKERTSHKGRKHWQRSVGDCLRSRKIKTV